MIFTITFKTASGKGECFVEDWEADDLRHCLMLIASEIPPDMTEICIEAQEDE